jgi:hypothetical protein
MQVILTRGKAKLEMAVVDLHLRPGPRLACWKGRLAGRDPLANRARTCAQARRRR